MTIAPLAALAHARAARRGSRARSSSRSAATSRPTPRRSSSSKRRLVRDADVVDEHVEAAERLDRLARPACSGAPGSERSAATWSAAPTSAAPPRPLRLRPHMTTCAPSATSSRAVSRPIPPVEPVTTQTRPLSPRSTAASVASRDRRSSSHATARPTGTASTASRATPTRRSTRPAARRRASSRERSPASASTPSTRATSAARSETAAAIAGRARPRGRSVDPGLREIDVGGLGGAHARGDRASASPGRRQATARRDEEHAERVLARGAADRGRATRTGACSSSRHGGTLRRAQAAALVERSGTDRRTAPPRAVRSRTATLLAVD